MMLLLFSQSVVSDSCDPMDFRPPSSSDHGSFQAEYWSGLPFPFPGDLPDPGIEAMPLASPALAGGFFTTSATWEAPSNPLKASYLHRNIKKSNYKLFSSGHSQQFTII